MDTLVGTCEGYTYVILNVVFRDHIKTATVFINLHSPRGAVGFSW